ncbi:MAG: aldehyde dehydrogenase family protein [Herpetosiphonaceae bacterium]|nr:aldehyde dehydrogenase family protein [Herpetosiphonaceae bacterium]
MQIAEIFETMSYGPAPETAKPALDWLAAHDRRFQLFIDNGWRDPAEDGWFTITNPATGQELAQVAQGSAADVGAAVAAAHAAAPGWRALPGHLRARYLYALARQIQKQARLLAVLETLDNGKPIRETRDLDIPLVARHFYYHAGWAQLMATSFPDYEPVGVIGQIIPWNFPLLMLAWKVAPALAMGNTVVLKPAEYTPLTALLFAEIVAAVGLPPGVLNVVTGDGTTGALLVEHPDIDKIAFTGSTEVGRIIRRTTAGTGKRLSLELGGKSPFIVFDDADLDSAVEGVVDAIWFNQGQVCCAGSRLLVQEGVAPLLHSKLRARMERLRIGDPLDKAIDIGAIVAPVQLERINTLVQQGVADGATLWQPSWACPTEGSFFPPTLFTDVAPASNLAQVEIFGPVLVSMTFRTPSEAVLLANNTRYGLAASVWSEDINLALDVAQGIKAGTIWINSTNLFDAAAGFGGYRESGFGREGGKEGLWDYLKLRVAIRGVGIAPVSSPVDPAPVAGSNGHAPASNGHLPAALFESVPIDRTAKLYIGGKQARPDSGYSRPIHDPQGRLLGEVGIGNRKDIRNAVEAARSAAAGWAKQTGHVRAQILYYLAENLAVRTAEFARRIADQRGASEADGRREVEAALEALFSAAAWADKYDGAVHQTPMRTVTLAVHEPVGVLGIACPDAAPLLALIVLVAPALAMGNTVVVIPSPHAPLTATDLYQVLETSDLPSGVLNIVTGDRDELGKVLAEHDDVDGVWYAGPQSGQAMIERASSGNMKRTWTLDGVDWQSPPTDEILRAATQVKNIWVPFGA